MAPIQTWAASTWAIPWFNTSSFAQTGVSNVQGSTGRNDLERTGPFLAQCVTLADHLFSEGRRQLQMMLQAFNCTNTPQFSNPNTGFGSNFGFVTGTISSGTGVNGTGGGRLVQLGC